MARPKKINQTRLTLDHILDENKKYEELQTVTLDGVGFTEIYKYFSPTKIEDMLKNFSKFVEDYTSTVEVVEEKRIFDFLNVFILIYFSTLVDMIPKTHEEKADIVEKVLNSEIAEKVAESFDKKEIEKIMIRLDKKFKAVLELYQANVDTRNQIIQHVKNSKLDNKDVILSAMFGVNEESIVEDEIEMSEENS